MTVNEEVYRDVLNTGYTLHWYEVKSVLGRGAFGVTYLARDKNLDQLVAIKEYFPHDFSSRASGYTVHPTTGENKELFDWGLNRFTREAQILAKFKHHNIVRVLSVFELNNTAYMVMEYEQGEELSKLYKRNQNLSEQALLDIFLPIMEGLKLVHDAGFIHRDIKPANIYLRADKSPVLIDFGAARKTVGTPTRAITSLVTVGYAPFEQYNESDEKQGAWTDIYALGACLYSAVSGRLPHDALARGSSLLSRGIDPYEPLSATNKSDYSHGFLLAIDYALVFQADQRPQDILFWADMLSGKVDVPPLPTVSVKHPMEVNDATVIKARPRSVPPSNGVAQAEGRTITSPRLAAIRPESRLNVKVIVLLLFALSVFVAGAIVIFSDKGGAPVVEEEVVEKSDQRQLASLLVGADEARKAGQLIDRQGGAIYFYKRILDIDPANSEAAQRIEEIIGLYADGIRSDLLQGFDDKAERSIQLLQAAVPESSAVLKLIDEVRIAKANQRDVSELLQQAGIDFETGRLISPLKQNALWRYRRILVLAPGNPAAIQGIETILAHYVTLAKKNLKQDDIASAERNIKDIITVDPDSVEVETLREALSVLKAEKPRREKVLSLLSKAQIAFATGNILNPPDISAFTLYQRVLKLDKNNSKANKGIKNVERYLDSRFKKYLSAGDFVLAKSLMGKIEKRMPRSRFARNVRAEWERSKSGGKPDIDTISDMVGKFKHGFESRDVDALQNMSEFITNRKAFLLQFFNNYTAFRLNISGVKYIGHKRTGSASVAIVDLVNKRGVAVEPGTWSRFEIKIYRNTQGKWKIVW